MVGIDPFDAGDVMKIYNNILTLNFKFTRKFPTLARSLVKRLLVVNVSERLGNLKNGANDVK